MEINPLIEEYCLFRYNDKKQSIDTVTLYYSRLHHMYDEALAHINDTEQISMDDFTSVAKYYTKDGDYVDTKIVNYVSCLKNFYKWLIKNNYTSSLTLGDFVGFRCPIVADSEIETLSYSEFHKLVSKIEVNYREVRDTLGLVIIYYTGLTTGQTADIKLEDVDFEHGVIHYISYDHIIERLDCTSAIQDLLNLYRKLRAEALGDNESPYLFVETTTFSQISRMNFNVQCKILVKRAGFSDSISPTTLRYSFVMNQVMKVETRNEAMNLVHYVNVATLRKFFKKKKRILLDEQIKRSDLEKYYGSKKIKTSIKRSKGGLVTKVNKA